MMQKGPAMTAFAVESSNCNFEPNDDHGGMMPSDLAVTIAEFEAAVLAERTNFRVVLVLLTAGTALALSYVILGSISTLVAGLSLVSAAVVVDRRQQRQMRLGRGRQDADDC